MTSIIILKELLEDNDPIKFIFNGADANIYDKTAELIYPQLSKDLSIDQLQRIIWTAFYQTTCVCEVAISKEVFVIDESQAAAIIGGYERFKDLAYAIRHDIIGL